LRISSFVQLAAVATVALLAPASVASAQDYGAQFQSYMAKQNIIRPGMGEDAGELQGDPVSMPDGVRVVGKLRGLNPGSTCGGGNSTAYAVQVCMKLCNDTGRTITIVLPAGTALKNATKNRSQNAVLQRTLRIRVPPKPCPKADFPQTSSLGDWMSKGAMDVNRILGLPATGFDDITEDEDPSEDGFQVTLGGFCLNEGMAPSEEGGEYELGPVLSDPDIRALLARVGDRELDEDQQQIFQTAIYSITEGRGLTPADESALRQFRSR